MNTKYNILGGGFACEEHWYTRIYMYIISEILNLLFGIDSENLSGVVKDPIKEFIQLTVSVFTIKTSCWNSHSWIYPKNHYLTVWSTPLVRNDGIIFQSRLIYWIINRSKSLFTSDVRFFFYFLLTVNCSQIADEIANIIKDIHRIALRSSKDTRNFIRLS